MDGFLRVLPRIVEPPLDFLGRVFLGHRPLLAAVDLFLRHGDLRRHVPGSRDLGDPRIVDFLGVFVVAGMRDEILVRRQQFLDHVPVAIEDVLR